MKGRSTRRFLMVAGAVSVAFAAAVAATNWDVIARARAVTARAEPADGVPFDVALVPGCHVDGDHPAPLLVARLEKALALYRSGSARRILVSGDERRGETRAMRKWLVARGVPAGDIVADEAGTRTIETMRRAASVFGVQRAAICTQPLHLDRSLFLARRAGMDAEGAAASLDLGYSLRWQAREALKRSLAFAEVYLLGRLPPAQPRAVLAARRDVE